MSKANEPAFPESVAVGPQGDICESGYKGLTKREYFAAMAMQALVTHAGAGPGWDDNTALRAVYMADALIAELEKESGK